MIVYYNEYNKYKNNVYDELREYCICERVNEEHLRTLIKKPICIKEKPTCFFSMGINGKGIISLMVAVFILIAIIFCTGCAQYTNSETEKNIIYESEALGFSLEFPGDWAGELITEEDMHQNSKQADA